ncbi:unnamed protein product [Ectocarpus sp. 12 AP-2014]
MIYVEATCPPSGKTGSPLCRRTAKPLPVAASWPEARAAALAALVNSWRRGRPHGRERGPPHVCGCRRPREASGTSGRGGSMARRVTPPSHGRPQSARFLQ